MIELLAVAKDYNKRPCLKLLRFSRKAVSKNTVRLLTHSSRHTPLTKQTRSLLPAHDPHPTPPSLSPPNPRKHQLKPRRLPSPQQQPRPPHLHHPIPQQHPPQRRDQLLHQPLRHPCPRPHRLLPEAKLHPVARERLHFVPAHRVRRVHQPHDRVHGVQHAQFAA